MKYEAEIDLRNANTSHALLVELVGRERRVLDVGCAGGDLGRMLKRRGCTVSGVEIDPAAAEAARHALDEVLVGDAAELDLVGHFGGASFDVVVFGDVLEHLVDPVAVLRRIGPLLDAGGSVVASVPNVAHGSVRLALLQGRFEYRSLGLLDDTHLRFFTRGSVHQLFRDAGLSPVDVRRTTVGVFDTEVPLRREEFDEGVVDAVVGDPESLTYQFVLRAVPEDGSGAVSPQAAGVAPPPASVRCRVGVWGDFDVGNVRSALILRVTCAEIARRIAGATVRPFSSSDHRAGPHDGGLAVEPLGPWSPERAAALAAELDCVVIAGDLPEPLQAELDDGRHPTRFLYEGVAHEAGDDCPHVWSAVGLPRGPQARRARGAGAIERGDAEPAYRAVLEAGSPDAVAAAADGGAVPVPDPLLLVPRLLNPEAVARRLELVRLMGWYPEHGPTVVVEVDGGLLPWAGAVAEALDAAVAASDAGVVLVDAGRDYDGPAAAAAVAAAMGARVHVVPADAVADDLVAVFAGAAAVAVRSATGAALGLAYERPMAYVSIGNDASLGHLAEVNGAIDGLLGHPRELHGLLDSERFRPTVGVAAKLQTRLDTHFDRIAAVADAAAAARPRAVSTTPVLAPSEYIAAVETAHRRMQARLDTERRAVAERLSELRRRHGALAAERDALAARLAAVADDTAARDEREADLRRQRDDAVAQLDALQGILVLRVLRPARAVYARLRGGRL